MTSCLQVTGDEGTRKVYSWDLFLPILYLFWRGIASHVLLYDIAIRQRSLDDALASLAKPPAFSKRKPDKRGVVTLPVDYTTLPRSQ